MLNIYFSILQCNSNLKFLLLTKCINRNVKFESIGQNKPEEGRDYVLLCKQKVRVFKETCKIVKI